MSHSTRTKYVVIEPPGFQGLEIPVRVYTPPGKRERLPVMVFFHGGGWVVGTLETHDPYCRALAMEAEMVVPQSAAPSPRSLLGGHLPIVFT